MEVCSIALNTKGKSRTNISDADQGEDCCAKNDRHAPSRLNRKTKTALSDTPSAAANEEGSRVFW